MVATDVLGRSELFEHLEAEELERLAGLCREFACPAGAVIFREGDRAADLYVLAEGRVALETDIPIMPDRPPVPTTVDLVGPNDCFGWSALVEPYTLTASARCMSPSTGVAIGGDALREFMRENPAIGYGVMGRLAQIVSQRLSQTRMRLTTQLARVLDRKEW